ncbi:hypothetical protein T440DRAFT_473652 [Plenodomus tracheiphilus IPT5]|uniref:Zn(2)-C6 fungal-type domain-containing protein n=1 Tax=Plenodomus tracheiphilus IPT5 TaxID=1408161 RepID=A0A6A7ALW9_9PLEO|nr:hypothetical protein T440DRAFT_473652 [Plenodomus tracheiphilus IPT5]
MDETRKRVKQACDRCRIKKTKCDGERLCGGCRVNNSLCSYSQVAGRQQNGNSYAALVENQNKQLENAVQTLYQYVQTGHSLPALPGQSMGDGRPFLHEIVTYLDAVPMGATIRHDQLPYQIPRLNTTPTAFLLQPQPESLPNSTFVAIVSEPNNLMASSMQQGLPLLEYESLESRLDLQEIYSLMDMDGAEAAGLYWLQCHTAR